MLLFNPQQGHAASGGRIGGGSFRAPSIPRTGGYGGGYRGGGYRGYGGYRGGGMGFPFLLPIFGFGGGGLFGFLILMSIAGVIVNSIRGGGNSYPSTQNPSPLNGATSMQGVVTMTQLQIGLLAKAKDLQEDLRKLAASSDTQNSTGLQKVLQETTLALLRQPNLWVYANLESGEVPFSSAESTFNRLSMIERSKLKAEITTNVSGQLSSENPSAIESGAADATNEYIAVTVLTAVSSKMRFKECNTSEELKDALRIIGSSSSSDLIALEVIWQPEGQGEVLTAEELVTNYPNLKHL